MTKLKYSAYTVALVWAVNSIQFPPHLYYLVLFAIVRLVMELNI